MNQSSLIGANARIPNPALRPLAFLIGEWRTTGSHPQMPGQSLTGRASFSWHEGGAFLISHTEVDAPHFPDGVAIIGSDDVAGTFWMIYFDQRGVSRHFEVTVGEGTVSWRRIDPRFSQTTTISVRDGGDTLVSEGRMSKDGGPWTEDLSQVYTRVREPAAR